MFFTFDPKTKTSKFNSPKYYENINIRNFHCGHVIAESKGGDSTIKNVRPICAACNSSMGTMSMSEFTKTYFGRDV